MNFTKYPSLENHYQGRFINSIRKLSTTNHMNWIVTEKVHGANFSFWTDGDEVKVASRSQFVDGTFYACSPVIEKYESAVLNVFQKMKSVYGNIKNIAIFGELYGQGVQKGIIYKHEKDFIAFDILLELEDQEPCFLSWETVVDYLENQIPVVPVLFSGSFEECLGYQNLFDSTIPSLHGIQVDEPNVCEGVVIRPEHDTYLHNGKRVIIKSKNDSWSEKQKTKNKNNPRKFEHEKQPIILQYINTQRMNNVLSKIGSVDDLTIDDFGRILGLMSKDVVDDLIDDQVLPENWKKDDQLKPLGGWITLQVKSLLMTELVPNL